MSTLTKYQWDTRALARPATLLLVLVLAAPGWTQGRTAPRRLAAVHLSDGQVLTGQVLLTPGINFALAAIPEAGKDFGQTRTFNVDLVKEMSFSPYTRAEHPPERMMQPYKFDDNDRYKRIPTGKPYPVREVALAVKFNNGQELSGVLASVTFYVQPIDPDSGLPGDTQRFILKSKYTGEPGETLNGLVYVTRIRMLDEGTRVAAKLDAHLLAYKIGPKDAFAAITRESLEGVPTAPADKPDHYEVGSTFGENIFVAARTGDKYFVGWPAEGTRPTELFKAVEKNVRELRDYFTDRKLLGIIPNQSGSEVLALVSLRRRGRVPANAYKDEGAGEFDEKGQPMEFFRVSVWQWKRDPKLDKMILVRRGTFFRVRVDVKADTPQVEVTQDLWPIVMEGDRVTVGKASGRLPGGGQP